MVFYDGGKLAEQIVDGLDGSGSYRFAVAHSEAEPGKVTVLCPGDELCDLTPAKARELAAVLRCFAELAEAPSDAAVLQRCQP